MLLARRLSPQEQDEVARWLRSGEAAIYWAQQKADQRHGLVTARKLAAQAPDDLELIRAGLLHDVGKSGLRISAFGRSLATLADLVGLPLSARYQAYRDHGPIGGSALAALGAEPLAVAFASRHPGGPPPDMDPVRWQLLLEADDD